VNIARKGLHHCLIGLIAGLSLLVAPAAACLCDDLPEIDTNEIVHLHQHHDSGDSAAEICHHHECTCAQSASAAMAKPEGVKLVKHFVVLSVLLETAANVAEPIISIRPQTIIQNGFRDLFYSSEPSRGPPAS
jgi:hypothetical protein